MQARSEPILASAPATGKASEIVNVVLAEGEACIVRVKGEG